jgi:hypothetical protein
MERLVSNPPCPALTHTQLEVTGVKRQIIKDIKYFAPLLRLPRRTFPHLRFPAPLQAPPRQVRAKAKSKVKHIRRESTWEPNRKPTSGQPEVLISMSGCIVSKMPHGQLPLRGGCDLDIRWRVGMHVKADINTVIVTGGLIPVKVHPMLTRMLIALDRPL